MKTYLITGGAGFIGSTLADRLLLDGNQVIVVDNFNDYYDVSIKEKNVAPHLTDNNYKLYRIDICDWNALEKVFKENHIDGIVHLAARAGVRPSIEDPILYQQTNNLGTNYILELAKKYGVKNLVLASSSSVYGNNKKVPFKETDVVDFAISPYAATKKSNEVLGHVYHALYGMNMIFLRFFTVYGPRQRPDLAINKFTKLILNDEPIPVFGDGSTSRDYTYIQDIINGIVLSIQYVENHENVYEIINLGENTPITLLEMIQTIEKVLGKKAKMNFLPMQLGDVNKTYADITKAKELLGYNPQTSFEEGIRNFVKWYKEGRH
ncbi:nAD-dependent epimerase/dehydratase [Coprobacillus sp. CAG:826]|nr:nAD-dependent epimerase/dehydratase [Coprobacillus sp. CAG:826]DAW45650.1 MAG TPA: hypothetical protein [Caudoviricetes sp.]